jgi:NitT/TauT family transport system substrate-binding protein
MRKDPLRSPIPRLMTLVIVVDAIASVAAAQTPVRVGWCTKVVTSAAAPYAIAMKFGWFEKAGLKVELLATAGSSECVKFIATREYAFALPALDALAAIRAQGGKIKVFYTAYETYNFRIAVPADSPIQNVSGLKGKKIGVNSMGSNGVLVAKGQAARFGLDPERDITLVAVGEGGQAAALIKSKQVDAYSSFDTQFALAEIAGVSLRYLDAGGVELFPGAGILALEETLATRRAAAVAIAQSFAKGSIFAMANPEAAVRIVWEVWPHTKPTGKDEATALADEEKILAARANHWRREPVGAQRWGESVEKHYVDFLDFLYEQKVIKQRVDGRDMFSNELISEINAFDEAAIVKMAKEYKVH